MAPLFRWCTENDVEDAGQFFEFVAEREREAVT